MKKTTIAVLVILVIFLALIAFGFFSQSRLSTEALTRYKDHLTEISNSITGILKEKQDLAQTREALTAANNKLEEENQVLKAGAHTLQEDAIKLRQELIEIKRKLVEDKENKKAAGESPGTKTPSVELAAITDKIKAIASAIDKIDTSSRQKSQLNASLRSIYNELYSLDLNIVKLAAAKNEGIPASDKDILKEVSRRDEEIKKLWEKVSLLEKENVRLVEDGRKKAKGVQPYLDEIARLNKEKEDLSAQLSRYRDQFDKLTAQLNSPDNFEQTLKEKENIIRGLNEEAGKLKKDFQSANERYAQVKQRQAGVESELASRAEKIVNLETALEEKNSVLLDLTVKVQDQLKELVALRESSVKSKLLNARLGGRLKEKEAALDALRAEVAKINEFNSQFKDYADRVSRVAAGPGPLPSRENPKSGTLLQPGTAKDKQVNVEIESVQVKQDFPAQEDTSGKKSAGAGSEAKGE